MSCIGPIANILVQIVILIVAVGIIRIVIAAFLGMPWYPAFPYGGPAAPPAPGAAPGRIAGAVLAILDLIFWGAVAICLIWLVVAALGCLGGFHLPRFG